MSPRRARNASTLAVLALASGLVAGCAVGPNYTPPKTATTPAYGEAPATPDDAPISQPSQGPTELSAWWTQFQDAELNRLVDRALAGNLDLQSAASRIRQARQQTIIAGAPGLPSVNANGLGARLDREFADDNSSGSQSGGSSSGGFTLPSSLQLYSLGFDATWELDLFGGVRRAVEAARADADAAVWSRRDVEVSMTAEVAKDYLTYRALQHEAEALLASQKAQTDMLGIAVDRAKHGVVTQLDVNQQNGQLAMVRASLAQLQAQARAQVHALGVLLGQPPEALSDELAATAPTPAVPKALPVGLPSDLLRRRPDVREAERQLASATANVGVAEANLYPKFNLIGSAALTSTDLSQLLTKQSFGTIAAGMVQWPLFQGGRIRANIGAAKEKQTQAYLAYQKAVLQAVADVEDALARYDAEQRRNLALQQADASSKSSYAIARDQYTHGLTSYLEVLTSQTTLLQDDDQLAESDGQLAQDLVSLFKALGGGWSESEPAATAARS